MGLHHSPHPAAGIAQPRRSQGGRNLCGMMPIVINHGDAPGFAFQLESAANASIVRQCLAGHLSRNAAPLRDDERRGGIQSVVDSRNRKRACRPGLPAA